MRSSSTLRVDPGFVAHSSGNADAANAAVLDTTTPSVARAQPSLQALVDSYQRNDASRTIIGTLPVSVTFPTVGPSLFLASELTAEDRPATVELDIKKVN
jgi:hypothetical protein